MAVPDHVNQNLTDSDTDANDSVTCGSALQNNMNPKRRDDLTSAVDFDDEIIHGMTASYTEISFNTQSSEPDDSLLEDNNLICAQESASAVTSFGEKGEENLSTYAESKKEDFVSERPTNLPLKNNPDNTTDGSDKENQSKHKALDYLNQLNGTVTQEGDMVLFVAEDLENKIKLSSPVGKKDDIVATFDSGNSQWMYRQSLFNQLPVLDIGVLNDLEVQVGKIATSVDSLTENLAEILHSVSALTVDCLETYRDVVCKTCDAVDLNIKSTYQLMAKCEELSKSMKPIYKLLEHIKEIKNFLDLFENATN